MEKASKAFLDKYRATEGFPEVTYFPGASVTTGFGHDNTYGEYRWHNGIDRAGGNHVFCPFDCYALFDENYGSFGNLLFLFPVDGDFEIRIAHFSHSDFTHVFEDHLRYFDLIKSGEPIGKPGNAGLSTGRHTHLEIVSKWEKSEVCDWLLERKHGKDSWEPYAEKDAEAYGQTVGLKDAVEGWKKEYFKRKVVWGNGYQCLRQDYHTGEQRTFYNSFDLFGL